VKKKENVNVVVWTILVVAGAFVGCVPKPSPTSVGPGEIIPGGTFVVCEGLWRQNNSVLSYINPVGVTMRDVVSVVNAGQILGDNASDAIAVGDTVFVVVSTSASIERFHRVTGKWIDRLRIPNGKQPYRICYDGIRKIYCSLLNDDAIMEIDARTLHVTVALASVGPAPEGIASIGGFVYVALSGLGDVRVREAGSGTITILRTEDLRQVSQIVDVPNCSIVRADPGNDNVWAAFRNLPSKPDSAGGVVKISASTQKVIARFSFFEVRGLAVDSKTGDAFVLHRKGIDKISATDNSIRNIVKHESTNGADVWYSLFFDARADRLLIGNARQYVTDGEVLVVDQAGVIESRHQVGLNPTAFIQ